VKKEEFERQVLELWVRTTIPLTEAHLQYASGESRRKVKKWLDQLAADGVVEPEAGDDGLVWSVPGSRRPADGPRTFAEYERLQSLRAEVEVQARARAEHKQKLLEEARERQRAKLEQARRRQSGSGLEDLRAEVGKAGALELANRAKKELTRKPEAGEKSLLVSGGLSMIFGPLGWLYAGSFRESIPAALVYLLAAGILMKLPFFLLMPIMFVALPLSGVAGLVYAWQYNRSGERKRLWGKDDEDGPDQLST
jgi:hypothetical protein